MAGGYRFPTINVNTEASWSGIVSMTNNDAEKNIMRYKITDRRVLLDFHYPEWDIAATEFVNRPDCFVTPEPLGPGGNPYPAMHGKTAPLLLDELVKKTADYFRHREIAVLQG